MPDFIGLRTKTIVEAKGRFVGSKDRTKLLAINARHPDYRIVLYFQNPDLTISKRSKTTYAQWAEKHGIGWRWI
ncbi:hypothetical protein [Roseomonas chloroacetimidivorans]|uniref:hypothetical protein n=1 Tax=Roseomonas chloroacetimidivorans TaxID=1766656 RepID=UPI003C75A436